MRNDGARLYDGCMENYFDEYNSIIDAEKEKIDKKYDPANLFTWEYDYSKWYEDLNDEKKTR